MQFEIGIYTVVLLVGPSQSGKTTWANCFQKKVTEVDSRLRTTILSSDSLRRELLGADLHRYDVKMMEASEAAFDLLFAKLKAAIRFPINNEFVIVDTTGLDPEFRRQVGELAKENGYRTAIVAFDYPTGDYFNNLTGNDKTIVGKHVETFKKRTLPGIKRKHYDYYFTVKAKSPKYFEELEYTVVDYPLWNRCTFDQTNFDSQRPLAIIGDVHEHVFALEMLGGRLPTDAQWIFVGDLFDKGNQTKEMLDFIEPIIEAGAIIVRGNHESFVARRLRGEIDKIANEDDLFPSYQVFREDAQLAARFLKIYDAMLPFACIKTHGKTIYVTHAPCYNKSLGKLDERSQKYQRNFYFSSRENDHMMAELDFIGEQAKNSHPFHVFGHVAHNTKDIEFKNKIWLDTGAVYGGKLSAFVVFPGGNTKVVSQAADKLTEGKLLYRKKSSGLVEAVSRLEKPETTMTSEKIAVLAEMPKISGDLSPDYVNELAEKYKLSPDDKYWLHSFNESGAKFISGTMSPSRSTRTALEPVNSAIEYFKSKGIDKVIIQPKYMGSRLQLYLHRNRELDFAVTRSGTKAGHQKEMVEVFKTWHKILDSRDFWKEEIVLDGELLPWSALGRELIDKEFFQYGKSIERELNLLASDEVFKSFGTDLDVAAHKKEMDTFLHQLELYGQDCPIHYHPFSVLAVDGVSWLGENQHSLFSQLLPNEPHLVVDLGSDNAVEIAEMFFTSLTESGSFHEGIVIKPLVYKTGVAPYMKVRNENYLHLIYGYDYRFNYQKMVENKRIGKKLELSIKEFELGGQMLNAKSKRDLLELACKMKFQMNAENELDPRL